MAKLPASLQKVSLFLRRLPGIGEKSANRLAFFLLRLPEQDLIDFAGALSNLKSQTKRCAICENFCEQDDICDICQDTKRDHQVITVVESVLDILSFETGGIYDGVYHVLHGKIDPLNRVSAEDLTIDKLMERVQKGGINEIILATNPDMEGEATAMYIRDRIAHIKNEHNLHVTVTRLAYGLPMGGNVEYADYVTLKKAIQGRSTF
ncbi:MAG TPA: recombination mediator RecR [Candidatus Woesebacteria bacterium]|nr:recombination mediator RecR [Candidatus Woesebacteria bacterium]HNS94409.1 recombination mediator RecR [Candidatus Woesebacteria bacterium]